MSTIELIENLASVGVRCLAMESVTSVRTAADNYRHALAVLDATVAVMECATRLTDLDRIVPRSEALRSAIAEAETALQSTEHYLEQVNGAEA